ncbi:MAG: cytochrome b N-terminal domain-containing protein [Acidobacteria bacterium]|nr:cytochrome b N-terminal domain-containing protein [Acidobacteriota bacterium]
MKGVLDFLETRTGLVTLWGHFANERVPRRRAWLFTLGSLALFAFLVQFLTGLLLALHYAPTPDHAHASVTALESKVAGGSLARGLHHWGATALVILVALHMVRTFAFGSYRKPREANWIVGVVLLLVVLGFGFTGYLLPWDQKAYWATVVGVKVAGSMPVVGEAQARLMAGGPQVGAYTLTRFYTIHVVLLPLVMLGLIGAHLALLRKHGHAGPTTGPDPREPFFPYQAARDAVMALLLLGALLWLAARHPAPLEAVADPSDTSYVPRPEWYFLPLFQLLKYFEGPLEPIGTAVLPGLAVGLLMLVPWLDRAKERRPSKRKPILLAGGVFGLVTLGLLGLGWMDKPVPKGPVASGRKRVPPPPDPRLIAGALAYESRGCASCHGAEGAAKPADPAGFVLVGRPVTWADEKLTAHILEKSPPVPTPGPDDEAVDPEAGIAQTIAFAKRLTEGPLSVAALPAPIRVGGNAIDREDCRNCHHVYGEGGSRGPALEKLAGRHDAAWLVTHFKDPKSVVPDSKMPSYKYLSDEELSAMAAYLLALP